MRELVSVVSLNQGDNWVFFLLPGHERLEVERVVEQHGGYFVVEKPTELLTGTD